MPTKVEVNNLLVAVNKGLRGKASAQNSWHFFFGLVYGWLEENPQRPVAAPDAVGLPAPDKGKPGHHV